MTRDEWVHGEVYALTSPGALAALDDYEDFDRAVRGGAGFPPLPGLTP